MRRILILAGAAATLAGCAFQRQVHNIAVDYNEAVASTSNELTFLNIVRARERHPLHFTTISAMRGGISLNLASDLSVGFRGEGVTTNLDSAGNPTTGQTQRGVDIPTPRISGSVTTGPSFDVGILNTQDFQRGILQPVTTKVAGHFLEQGWPPAFLTALFVERVEFVLAKAHGDLPKGTVIRTLTNDPDDPDSAYQFSAFLGCFTLAAASTGRKEEPLADYNDLSGGSTIADIGLLDGSKFDVSEVIRPDGTKKKMIVRVTPSAPALKLSPVGAGDSCRIDRPPAQSGVQGVGLLNFKSRTDTSAAAVGDLVELLESQREGRADVTLLGGAMQLTSEGRTFDVDTRMVIRSPSAIIYFLGEYARVSDPYEVNGEKLIVVREGNSGDSFVRTHLAGKSYYIPSTDNGRSLQTLSIVQQLVNLHKNSADLPSTGAVQIVR